MRVFRTAGGGACLLAGMLLLAQAGRPASGPRPIQTTPLSPAIQRSEQMSKRPLPILPAPRLTLPDQVWVPDRYVGVPGEPSFVHVPGHWERNISPTERYAPPLVGCNPATSSCVQIPGGVRPPPELRPQSP